MRFLISILCFISFCISKASLEPTVVADIAKQAIEHAASPDGVYIIAGISIDMNKYISGLKEGGMKTSQKINDVNANTGISYTHSFKNNAFIGGDIIFGIGKKRTKKCSWLEINEDLDRQYSTTSEQKTAQIETSYPDVEMALKGGYCFLKYRLNVYGKLGASKIGAKCKYSLNSNQILDMKIDKVVPCVALGVEHLINSKFSVNVETRKLFKANINKEINGIQHKIAGEKTSFRIYVKYKGV